MKQHPENKKRALWAGQALDTFQAATGTDDTLDTVKDCLCGIGHFCDLRSIDFLSILAKAVAYWKIEQTDPLGLMDPPPVHIAFAPVITDEALFTALCIWECLAERAVDPIHHPELTRRREDIGTVALRESVAGLIQYVDAVYELIAQDTRESYCYDWTIVPAILETLQWDCDPVIVRDHADAAAIVTRVLTGPPLPEPVPVSADNTPPHVRPNAEFEELFQPLERNDNQLLWQHGAIPSGADARYWWSVVEGDNGAWYISPGFRVVNRMGYIRCRVPRAADETDYPDYAY